MGDDADGVGKPQQVGDLEEEVEEVNQQEAKAPAMRDRTQSDLDIEADSRTDRYGFLVTDARFHEEVISPEERVRRVAKENERLQKWLGMMGSAPADWFKFRKKNSKKVKQRCRKGIPEAVRGRAWNLLMEANLVQERKCMEAGEDVFSSLLRHTNDIPYKDTIDRDIGRTFPRHQLFRKGNVMGQESLRNVLYAYSVYDPDVGYCQGMGFITALFLSYMPQDDAFWLLVAVVQNPPTALRRLYLPGMPLMQRSLYVWDNLFKAVLPELWAHFKKEDIHGTMYATQWYITLFTNMFPFELVTRVWDSFLCEGWKVVHRVGLAMFKTKQEKLMGMDFEELLGYFRVLPSEVDSVEVMDCALTIDITTAQVERLETEYELNQSSTESTARS